jgi:hypothetical protein
VWQEGKALRFAWPTRRQVFKNWDSMKQFLHVMVKQPCPDYLTRQNKIPGHSKLHMPQNPVNIGPMDCFTHEIIPRWTPLFFFSVKRLFCCITVFPGLSPVRVTLSLFSTSNARPWFRASFLCCERTRCRRSILRHFRVYVIAGSNVKFSRQWTTEMWYPFSHFESLSDFQTRKQNSAVFFVYKNYKLHI